jgi:hypothetical protein
MGSPLNPILVSIVRQPVRDTSCLQMPVPERAMGGSARLSVLPWETPDVSARPHRGHQGPHMGHLKGEEEIRRTASGLRPLCRTTQPVTCDGHGESCAPCRQTTCPV